MAVSSFLNLNFTLCFKMCDPDCQREGEIQKESKELCHDQEQTHQRKGTGSVCC